MVDGATINQLRQDLNTVTSDLENLKLIISAMKEKLQVIESLDLETLKSLIQSQVSKGDNR